MKNALLTAGLLGMALVWFAAGGEAAQEKRRTGTLSGVVTDRGDSKDGKNGWVEIRADGEEKGRRYWPAADPKRGGPDREILAAIRKVDLGARVRAEWVDAGDGKDLTKFEVLTPKK
jgi:hypothetical protein